MFHKEYIIDYVRGVSGVHHPDTMGTLFTSESFLTGESTIHHLVHQDGGDEFVKEEIIQRTITLYIGFPEDLHGYDDRGYFTYPY